MKLIGYNVGGLDGLVKKKGIQLGFGFYPLKIFSSFFHFQSLLLKFNKYFSL